MNDQGKPCLKATFIGLGEVGEQVRGQVQPLFDDLLHQARQFKSSTDTHGPADSQPMLTTVGEKSFLQTPCTSLQDAHLLYVSGSPASDDFSSTRDAILKNMNPMAYLFTFPIGRSHGFQSLADRECVIRVQGLNPMDDVASLVRDFTAWNMFPKTVACDWSDIRRCLMGQEKSLITYRSRVCDKGFGEFLNGLQIGDSSSVLLLVACNRKRNTSMEDIFTPLDMAQGKGGTPLKEGIPMIFLETCTTEHDDAFRASVLG